MSYQHDHQKGSKAAADKMREFQDADKQKNQPPPQGETPPKKPLPKFLFFDDIIQKTMNEPPLLLQGDDQQNFRKNALIHKGDKVILGSDSKAGKTWYLLQKSLCIAAGIPFMGHKTTQGVVLYCNFELRPWAFQKRVQMVAKSLGLVEIDGMGRSKIKIPATFIAWNLRGVTYDIEEVCEVAEERFRRLDGVELAAIAIDPLYKSYGEKDENSASDMGAVMKSVESFAEKFGAAIFIAAHFAKGDASGKAQLDRLSGSGVITRDPDGIFTLTRMKSDDDIDGKKLYLWEATLRNMASPDPKVVHFNFPIWEVQPGVSAKSAAAKAVDADALLDLLPEEGLPTTQFFDAAQLEGLVGRKTAFLDAVAKLVKEGKLTVKTASRGAKIYCRSVPI